MSGADLSGVTEEERGWADLATRRLFDKPMAEMAGSMETVGVLLTEELFRALVLIGRGIETLNTSMPEDLIRTAMLMARVMQRADAAMQRVESSATGAAPTVGKKITEIDLLREDREGEYRRLTARINETGDLVVEGQDVGRSVEAHWGDSDYEYSLTVDKEYTGTVMLRLLKEKFDNSTELKMWLEDNDIPFGFWAY